MPAYLLRMHHGSPRSEVLLRRLLRRVLRRRWHPRLEAGSGVVVLHHVLVVGVGMLHVRRHLHLRRRSHPHPGWGRRDVKARRGPLLEEAGGHGRHGQKGRCGRGHRAHLSLSGCPSLSPELLGPSPRLSTAQSLPSSLETVSLWHLVFVRR